MKSQKNRKCLECDEQLLGRKDQKFCADYCRNTYNNRLNEDVNSTVRKINSILRKNRRILAKLNPNGKKTVHLIQLAELGFNFHYYTNSYSTKKDINISSAMTWGIDLLKIKIFYWFTNKNTSPKNRIQKWF